MRLDLFHSRGVTGGRKRWRGDEGKGVRAHSTTATSHWTQVWSTTALSWARSHQTPPPPHPHPPVRPLHLYITPVSFSLSLSRLCVNRFDLRSAEGRRPPPTFPVPVRLMARHGGWTCRQWWETEAPLVAPGLVGGRLWNPPPRRADPGRVPPAERHREIERGRGRKTL